MSEKTDDDLHNEAMECADEAHTFDFDNRTECIDDLQFAVGGDYQWADWQNLKERRDNGQPCETINQLGPFIHQIENDARQNRPAIKVRGVDDESDPDTAELLEGLTRHIEDASEAVSTAYIPGIKNAATCGIGHWRIDTEYAEDDPFGPQDIFIRSIPNPLAVLWDPRAVKATREDAKYCFVLDDIPEKEYGERWPDKAVSDFGPGVDASFWRDQNAKTIRVAEYWVKEPYEKTFGKTQDGKSVDLTDIPSAAQKYIVTETRKIKAHRIRQYFISGNGILEGPNEWAGNYLPVIAVLGEEIWMGDKRIRKSLIRDAKSVQRLYNSWRNAQTEQIAMQPKSPYMATPKQMAGFEKVWKQANRRNLPYLPYNPDGTAPPPSRVQPPQISSAMSEAVGLALNELRAVTGIYDAALGKKSNETSGVAIQNRQKESDVSNAHFPDNLALSIRHTGRVLIDLIPKIYDTERVVRILGEDGSANWEKINSSVMTPQGPQTVHDLSVGKYDVTVKVGPSYATRRQEAADFLLQFIQSAPDSAQFVMDLIAKNLDQPGADELAKRFKLLLAKQHPEFFTEKDDIQPPPPTQQDQMNALMSQVQMREAEASARKTEAEADDAEMDAALKGVQVMTVAAQGPIEVAVQQAVMQVLSKFGLSGQTPSSPAAGPQQPATAPQSALAA